MRSYYNNGDEITLVHNGCDGCSPTVINGTFCHELSCPEKWRDIKKRCKVCGDDFYLDILDLAKHPDCKDIRDVKICPDCADF